MKKRKIYLYGILLLAPILLSFLIYKYAVNVPFFDQYELIPLFQKIHNGTLSFSDLWMQHNEHRIIFPSIMQLILAGITQWNIRLEIAYNFIVACIGYIGLLLMLRTYKFNNKYIHLAILFFISLLFFTPAQWENWLWGWQLEWFLCVTMAIFTYYFISKYDYVGSIKYLIYAAISSIIAAFSLGSGILVPIAGLIQLILLKNKLKSKVNIMWILLTAIITAAYYYNYKIPNGAPSLTAVFHKPIEAVTFFLAYIGRPVASEGQAAVIIGATFLISYLFLIVFLYKHRKLGKYSSLIALSLLALMAGAITTIGRLGFGIASGLSSRYTTFSVLFLISVIFIVMHLINDNVNFLIKKRYCSMASLFLLVVMTPLIINSYYTGIQEMKKKSIESSNIYSCSREDNPTDQCLRAIYPDLKTSKSRLDYLKSIHWGGY